MKAYIQHKDELNQKMILQALVPFTSLRDSVLFTYRSNDTNGMIDKQTKSLASMEFYQRRVDSKRASGIKDFIRNSILLEKSGSQLATLFPTSMIIAMSVDDGENGNKLEIKDDFSCDLELNSNVFIVDGQHRMMGMITLYDELSRLAVKTEEDDYVFDYLLKYKFNCTILVNYDLWEQGQVFVNVNFKQKPVNKSLYYEIFGSEYRENETDWERNRIYLAHKITFYLNEHPVSPFYQRIKMLGTGRGYVSQAFVVESLQRHFKRGGLWYFDPDEPPTDFNRIGCYSTELLSFFVAVKQLFPEFWPRVDSPKGTIICKTTGFGAWVRIMGMMREDNDTILLKQLNESARKEEVCKPYVEQVTKRLSPLQKYGEVLFGDNSEFSSSSGQGAEGKLYKKMLFYIQQQNSNVLNEETYPFDIDKVIEKLQEYLWENPVDELEILGHHYEVENIEDFKVVQYKKVVDSYVIKSTFSIYASIFIDNEDDVGFSLDFPAEVTLLWERDGDGDKFSLNESSVRISVDTDKYYQ